MQPLKPGKDHTCAPARKPNWFTLAQLENQLMKPSVSNCHICSATTAPAPVFIHARSVTPRLPFFFNAHLPQLSPLQQPAVAQLFQRRACTWISPWWLINGSIVSPLFFGCNLCSSSELVAAPSGAVVNMYIPGVWKSRAAAAPQTIAYGSTMCYLMRDLLTKTIKCVARLKSPGREVFASVACKATR